MLSVTSVNESKTLPTSCKTVSFNLANWLASRIYPKMIRLSIDSVRYAGVSPALVSVGALSQV